MESVPGWCSAIWRRRRSWCVSPMTHAPRLALAVGQRSGCWSRPFHCAATFFRRHRPSRRHRRDRRGHAGLQQPVQLLGSRRGRSEFDLAKRSDHMPAKRRDPGATATGTADAGRGDRLTQACGSGLPAATRRGDSSSSGRAPPGTKSRCARSAPARRSCPARWNSPARYRFAGGHRRSQQSVHGPILSVIAAALGIAACTSLTGNLSLCSHGYNTWCNATNL